MIYLFYNVVLCFSRWLRRKFSPTAQDGAGWKAAWAVNDFLLTEIRGLTFLEAGFLLGYLT